MVMFVGTQPRAAVWLRQAAQASALACVLALPTLLSGCESIEQFYVTKLPVGTAIDWWHDLQGGVIAEERPAPPGADDPFPNLATIPPKPTPTAAATRQALSTRLAAERDRTERLAAQDPLVPPRPVPPAPTPASATATPATATPAPPAPAPAATARIEAASAPPPQPTPAPPPAPPAPAAIQAAAAPIAPPRPVPQMPDAPPAPAAAVASGPVPALPTAPPPVPALGIPGETLAPATPRPAPQLTVAFLPNSAVLRPESGAALRELATRRAGGRVALLGGGDASSAQPDAQAAVLPLAWRRAQAMAEILAGAGVPASAMQIDAAALGRGGLVRLVQ